MPHELFQATTTIFEAAATYAQKNGGDTRAYVGQACEAYRALGVAGKMPQGERQGYLFGAPTNLIRAIMQQMDCAASTGRDEEHDLMLAIEGLLADLGEAEAHCIRLIYGLGCQPCLKATPLALALRTTIPKATYLKGKALHRLALRIVRSQNSRRLRQVVWMP